LIPIEDFFIGVCKTVLSDDELITEVQIPVPSKNQNSTYFKYTVRRALDLAMVGVAAALEVKGQVCEGIKIALGAVAVMPVRARQTEKMLEGKLLTDELIDNASRFASENECSPISDIRASKEYRKEIVRLLTRDVIKALSSPQVA
jgi:carbon-monoxide dehydrogenase medium subunit